MECSRFVGFIMLHAGCCFMPWRFVSPSCRVLPGHRRVEESAGNNQAFTRSDAAQGATTRMGIVADGNQTVRLPASVAGDKCNSTLRCDGQSLKPLTALFSPSCPARLPSVSACLLNDLPQAFVGGVRTFNPHVFASTFVVHTVNVSIAPDES